MALILVENFQISNNVNDYDYANYFQGSNGGSFANPVIECPANGYNGQFVFLTPQPAFANQYYVATNATSFTVYAQANSTDVYFGSRVYFIQPSVTATGPSSSLTFSVQGQGSFFVLNFNADRTVSCPQANNWVSNNKFNFSTWNFLEVYANCTTNGSAQIRINGESYGSFTGNLNSANNTLNVNFYKFSSAASQAGFTDVYVCDTTGTSFNNFLGDTRTFLLPPASNYNTQFTSSGVNPNYVNVNQPNVNISNYNYSNNVGATDLFTVTSIPSQYTALAVATRGGYYKDDAYTRIMKSVIKSGTSYAYGQSNYLTSSFYYYTDFYVLNPNGNVPWTTNTVNALDTGYSMVS